MTTTYLALKYRPLEPDRIHIYKAMDDGPDNWWVARWLPVLDPNSPGGRRKQIGYRFFNTWALAWAFVGEVS